MDFRIGIGYDVHSFKEGEDLVLGGVEIPYYKGLEGHSDADVLLHAVADAFLGSLALGDIGTHFPPGDPRYKNVSSIFLLEEVVKMLAAREFIPANLDSVILAQQPKLSPFVKDMRLNISRALGVDNGLISVKCTTTERLGFIGREEGIAAYAVVLVSKKQN